MLNVRVTFLVLKMLTLSLSTLFTNFIAVTKLPNQHFFSSLVCLCLQMLIVEYEVAHAKIALVQLLFIVTLSLQLLD